MNASLDKLGFNYILQVLLHFPNTKLSFLLSNSFILSCPPADIFVGHLSGIKFFTCPRILVKSYFSVHIF